MAASPAVDRKVTAEKEHVAAGPASDEFRVEVAQERHGVRVCPVGEVDLATIGQLRDRLYDALGAGTGLVILDLRETTFLDSTGLRLTVEAEARAASSGIEFAIVPGRPAVQRTFDIAGLTERLPFARVPHA